MVWRIDKLNELLIYLTKTYAFTFRLFELSDDIASRWGPRVPQLLVAVGAAIEKVGAGQ